MTQIDDTTRETLTALCDTIVPPVARAEDPDGFFARRASDVGVPQVLEAMLEGMGTSSGAGCWSSSARWPSRASRGPRSARASRSCATSRCWAPTRPPASGRSRA